MKIARINILNTLVAIFFAYFVKCTNYSGDSCFWYPLYLDFIVQIAYMLAWSPKRKSILLLFRRHSSLHSNRFLYGNDLVWLRN